MTTPTTSVIQDPVTKQSFSRDTSVPGSLYAPVPTTITSDTLAPAQPATVVAPQPATKAVGLQGYLSSSTDAFTQAQAADTETAKTNADNSFQALLKGLGDTEGQAQLTNDAYATTVDPAQADLNDINNQIIAEQTSARHQIEALQKNPQGLFGSALQDKIDEINTQSTSKQADLAVIQMAKQGKYDSAKEIADRAVSATLEKQQAQNQALQATYDRNKDLFTTDEQNAFETAQADRNRQLDLQAQEEKSRYDDLIQNASGAPSAETTPTYTLQAGDDPYNIAQSNGTDMATLQALNPNIADWHNIQPGTTLNLPLPAGVLSSDPQVNDYASGILNGSITSIAQVPKQYKDAVTAALNKPSQNGYSPLASSRFATASNKIVSNYIALPQYQLTANGLPYLQRIDAAIKTPGSVSDQDLLDSLTKLNTAGNAIADAQVKLITDGKSFGDAMNTFSNKLGNGGVLSTNQRQQIQTIAKAIYANYAAGYQPVYDQVTAQLKASGIPQAFWTIPDLNNLAGQSSGAPAGTPVTAPDGTRVIITD